MPLSPRLYLLATFLLAFACGLLFTEGLFVAVGYALVPWLPSAAILGIVRIFCTKGRAVVVSSVLFIVLLGLTISGSLL